MQPSHTSLWKTFLRDLIGAETPTALAADRQLREDPVQWARIRSEQISLMFRSTPAGIAGSFVGVAVAVVILWRQVSTHALLWWAATISTILVAELLLYLRFSALRAASRPAADRTTAIIIAFVCDAVAWGSTLFVLMPPTLEYQIVLVLILCVLGFGSTVYQSVYLPALYAMNLPLFPAIALGLFLQNGFVYTVLGLAMIAVLGAILVLGRHFNRTLTNAIAANLRSQTLMAEVVAQKEAAERANVAKTRFLASASHDLRQPMHTIGLLVGLLRGRPDRLEENAVIGKIDASVQAMSNLFSSLLDISKLDAGAVRPNIREFSIGDLLRALELHYTPQAQQKRLALRVVQSAVAVRSDSALLESILSNLITNAIRYTERGSVLVGCRRRGARLRIEVRDTGVGIPEAFRQDIFEEFFQLANPERDRSKGLGLGLSIVKRSAELLGHTLVVESQPGVGSVFSVEVPRVASAPPTAEETVTLSPSDAELAGAFVVIVDDEHDARFAAESLCRQWQCHVVSAGSAAEATTALARHLRVPDIIISDYRLRDGLTGLGAIADIRRQAEADIPAIVVTGDIAAADIHEVLAAGLPLMHKPVSADQLRRGVQEILAARRERRDEVN
jgi:signal transduction histidine kinase/CheY-like chemotaxis protein